MQPDAVSAAAGQRPWPLWMWWCALAGPEAVLLLVLSVSGNVVLPRDLQIWVRVGLMGAQISLAAAIAAWCPWPLPIRVAASWVWAVAAILMLSWFSGLNPSIDLVFVTLGLIQWLLIVGMFAAAWSFGIRLVDCDGHVLHRNSIRQFSLQDLLLFTAEVALALGLARAAWPDALVRWRMFDLTYLVGYWLTLTLGHALLFNAVITCFHVPRARWQNLLWSVLFAALITGLEVFALWKLGNPGDPWPILESVSIVNACQLAWLLFAVWRLEQANVLLRRVFFPKFTRLSFLVRKPRI